MFGRREVNKDRTSKTGGLLRRVDPGADIIYRRDASKGGYNRVSVREGDEICFLLNEGPEISKS
jgi:hypothetical protein